jgi:CRISPR-associated protein Cas8a1/Csx13
MQACIVVPDVSDLHAFARNLQNIATAGKERISFTNTYLNRVVGGAAEAALRFLIDQRAQDIEKRRGVTGCLAITMGKVAWDKNQVNRTGSIRIGSDVPEMLVFEAAITYFGKARILKSKKGDGFAVPASPIPELVAANLGAGRSWVANFRVLVDDSKKFQRMRFAHGGLSKMKEAIEDEDDRIVIQAYHEAWNRIMGALGERSKREGSNFDRFIEVESERNRNTILRAKTADALAAWFLRFCAEATKGSGLPTMIEHAPRIRKFIFEPRNFDRLQNLLLFALVSYNKEDFKKTEPHA